MMEPRHNTNTNNCVHFQKPTFLPMLCSKPSIKNVTLPSSISNQEPFSLTQKKQDPLSPKISCIGQVKRSNKITNFPTTTTTSTPNNTHNYFKLKRLFSTPITVTVKPSSKGRRRREGFVNESKKNIPVIDVVDLDPPLPVLKKKIDFVNGDKSMENLWKRRSGGRCELKSLQIRINGGGDEEIKMKVTTV